MNKTIERVVNTAFKKLSNFPELKKAIVKNNYFITTICDEKGNYYTLVDFTQEMEYNSQSYMRKSRQLFDELFVYPKWFNL